MLGGGPSVTVGNGGVIIGGVGADDGGVGNTSESSAKGCCRRDRLCLWNFSSAKVEGNIPFLSYDIDSEPFRLLRYRGLSQAVFYLVPPFSAHLGGPVVFSFLTSNRGCGTQNEKSRFELSAKIELSRKFRGLINQSRSSFTTI